MNEPRCVQGKCNYAVKNDVPPFCCDPNSISLNTTRKVLKPLVSVRADLGPSPCENIVMSTTVDGTGCNPWDHACPPCQHPMEPFCEEPVCSFAGVCECIPVVPKPVDFPDIHCGACPDGRVCNGDTGECVDCRAETDCPFLVGFCLSNRRCVEERCVYDGCPEGHSCRRYGTCVDVRRHLQLDCEPVVCEDETISRFGTTCSRTLSRKSLTVRALSFSDSGDLDDADEGFVKGLGGDVGVQRCCGDDCGSDPIDEDEALEFTFPDSFSDAEICLGCVDYDGDDDDDDHGGDDDSDADDDYGEDDDDDDDDERKLRCYGGKGFHGKAKGGQGNRRRGATQGQGEVGVYINGMFYDHNQGFWCGWG